MAEMVNFYDELGLGRDDSVSQIQEALGNLRLQLSTKAARPGSQQEKWQRQLELVAQAEETFADDDSRERYDIALRREGAPAEGDEQTIDWTTRAWNYYFVGDNGAAFVAARKAKEQAPKDAMPFVVSAWVQLKDNEYKQAKQDADEAFVLDEMTTDSVDVQMVRGTVYYCLGLDEQHDSRTRDHAPDDFNRALTSFERGLTKATPGEQSELYWRRGLVLGTLNRYQDACDSAMKGITIDVKNVNQVQNGLERVLSNAINVLDNVSDAAKAATLYGEHLATVSSASMLEESKTKLRDNISQNITRCQKLDSLRKKAVDLQKQIDSLQQKMRDLTSVKDASGIQPGIPLIAIVVAIIAFIIMCSVFSFSAGAGVVFLVITAIIVVFVVRAFMKRSAWSDTRAKFQQAQSELEGTQHQVQDVQRQLHNVQAEARTDTMTQAIPLPDAK